MPGSEVLLANPLRTLLERRSLQREVRLALESGVGLYQAAWQLDGSDRPPERWSRLVADWCRETFALTRRPYGLDYVTLTAAVIDGVGQEIAVAQLGVLRPADFYGAGPAGTQLEVLFQRWADRGALRMEAGRRLVAVLFSWGDLTRELLLAG